VPPEAPAAPPQADEDFGFDTQGQEGVSGGKGLDVGAGASGGEEDFTGFDVSAPSGQDAASQPSFGGQDFDFGAPPEGGLSASDEQPVAGGTNEWSFDAAGGSTPDFGAGGADESGEGDAFGSGVGFELNESESEPPAYGGDDANAPPPHEEPFMQPPPQAPVPAGGDWQIGSAEEEGGVKEAGPGETAGGEGLTAGGNEAAQSSESEALHADMPGKVLAASLSKSMEDESKSAVAEDKAVKKAAKKKKTDASSKGVKLVPLIILIVIISGAGAWYFGIRESADQSVMVKTVDIAAIDGRYDQTPNLGSFFVIEAKIKNITAVPQSVRAVTGVIYDAGGKRLASMPGRVISSDDIKNLTKEDLAKVGPAGAVGTIPPKGMLPVVVIFTKTPEGMAEYSIEITP